MSGVPIHFCQIYIMAHGLDIILLMIKQSFLRNYNIAKIYNQAETRKKKLQVFYIRQISKLAKEQRKENRDIVQGHLQDRGKMEKENQQDRSPSKELMRKKMMKKKGACTEGSEEEEDNRKDKVDLTVTTLQFHKERNEYTPLYTLANLKPKITLKLASPKMNSTSSPSFRPYLEHKRLQKISYQGTTMKQKKIKLMTTPSFYQHFQNVRLKETSVKTLKTTMISVVQRKLKREHQNSKTLKTPAFENEVRLTKPVEGWQQKGSLLASLQSKSIPYSYSSTVSKLEGT